jgi:hypothetical protein
LIITATAESDVKDRRDTVISRPPVAVCSTTKDFQISSLLHRHLLVAIPDFLVGFSCFLVPGCQAADTYASSLTQTSASYQSLKPDPLPTDLCAGLLRHWPPRLYIATFKTLQLTFDGF